MTIGFVSNSLQILYGLIFFMCMIIEKKYQFNHIAPKQKGGGGVLCYF